VTKKRGKKNKRNRKKQVVFYLFQISPGSVEKEFIYVERKKNTPVVPHHRFTVSRV